MASLPTTVGARPVARIQRLPRIFPRSGAVPSDVHKMPSGNACSNSAVWHASMASVVFPKPPAPWTSV